MKTFQIRDGIVQIDGVQYSSSPSESDIRGKMGRIHSINIEGRGQFFPIGGVFNDGTLPIVTDEPIVKKKGKAPKTELVEKSGVAVDESGKIIKKSRKTK